MAAVDATGGGYRGRGSDKVPDWHLRDGVWYNGGMRKPETVLEPGLSRGLRGFLYLTAAVNGAAIMIVEILGAKMLAPHLGTSHFVWTAQIGVAMASLAAGYYVGGRWADSGPRLGRLFTAMWVAAVYLALAVPGVRPVALGCLRMPLPAASLLASMFLFFVPLALLATTGPFLVRFLVAQLNGVGGAVGRLSALSTMGSLGGTALIGYVLIPLAPNSVTMWCVAGVIGALSLGYAMVWGGNRGIAVAAFLAVMAAGWGGVRHDSQLAVGQGVERLRKNSNFGHLQVVDDPGGSRRFYLNDYLVQNTYDPRTRRSVSMFTYALHGLATVYRPRIDTALCIGMGVGIVPAKLAAEGARVEVVEINPTVVPVAREFFDLDTSAFTLTIGDGRQYLNRCTNRFDVVVLDAFLGEAAPSHLMTREAFGEIRRVLADDGVLVINCLGEVAQGRDFLTASMLRTLRSVYADVRMHSVTPTQVYYVASGRPLERHRSMPLGDVHPAIEPRLRELLDSVPAIDAARGIVLTDDFNPAEYHDAENRELFRRYLVQGMEDSRR